MRIFGVAKLARHAFSRFRQWCSPDHYNGLPPDQSLGLVP